jgi:hypothetical protein
MRLSNRTARTLGVILYALGVLLILGLGAMATWGDLEASLFDTAIQAEKSLSSLRCPVLITRDEVGKISARFENTGTHPVNRAIRAHISQGYVTLIREESLQLPLQPGESQRWTFGITADDAAYGSSLILARVSTLRQAPMPSQSRACGIVVLGIPWISGAWVTGIWLALGLLGLVGGTWLWARASGPLVGRRRHAANTMIAIAAATLAVLAAGLAGAWVLGVLLLALWVLLMIAVAAQAILDD